MHILPAMAVLAVFMILSFWNWADLKHSVKKEQSSSLDKYMNDTSRNLEKELNSYVDVVSAGVGLFDASDYVNSGEWHRFVSIFDLKHRYPGIRNIGFAKIIQPGALNAYTGSVRSKENILFHVYPGDKSKTHASIVYTSPKSSSSDAAVGYDLYSDVALRASMERARDSGKAVIIPYLSGNRVFGNQPQLMIFSPIYVKNSRPDTQAERRHYIWGYTYADIITYSLINKIEDDDNSNFAFKVKSVNAAGDTPLYQSPGFSWIDSSRGKLADDRPVKVNNLGLNVHGVASDEIVPKRERKRPAAALWFGIFLSLFMGVFIYTLLTNRTKALKGKEFDEIQLAKDELLALASHQLRTPATGVKQYIGMLREGYGGKMTREQQKFLDQAYESNERQLSTINDMLFAARADNGDIEFNFKKTDLVRLTTTILNEQKKAIKDSGLKLYRRMPRNPIYVNGDAAYLRMAIENIINNAMKYTRSGGNITVRVRQTKSRARLSVDDTGVGVDEKYRHLLFKKFSRVPNDLSSSVTGSGIGLYLAKKVTDSHKGKISFKSADGQGSSCIITLPLYKKDK